MHELHKRTIVLLYGCWLTVECGVLGRAVVWASQHHSGSSLTYSNNWERRYLRFVQFVQSRRVARSDRCVLHQSQSESLLSIACAKSASCPGALAHAASSLTVRAWTMTTRTQHKCQEAQDSVNVGCRRSWMLPSTSARHQTGHRPHHCDRCAAHVNRASVAIRSFAR